MHPEIDNSTESFSWAIPNFVEVCDYAQEKFGWTRQKVDEIIKPVIVKMKETSSNQMKIVDFFTRERVGLSTQSSARVQAAVDKVLGNQKARVSTTKVVNKSKKASKAKAGTQEHKHDQDEPLPGPSSASTSAKTSIPQAVIPNSKEAEMKKKEEIKKAAIEAFKKSKTKVGKNRKPPRRAVVLEKHTLSESDSD